MDASRAFAFVLVHEWTKVAGLLSAEPSGRRVPVRGGFWWGYCGVREKGRRLLLSKCDGLGRWVRPENSRLPFARSVFGLRRSRRGGAGARGSMGGRTKGTVILGSRFDGLSFPQMSVYAK